MTKQSHDEKPKRDLDEWDAEIEAEFQRAVRQTKTASRRQRGSRFIGCPIAFMAEVRRKTKGCTALALALLIYRRTQVSDARTVTLPADELAELGINRWGKRSALAKLRNAGLIKVEVAAAGRAARVTLLWKEA